MQQLECCVNCCYTLLRLDQSAVDPELPHAACLQQLSVVAEGLPVLLCHDGSSELFDFCETLGIHVLYSFAVQLLNTLQVTLVGTTRETVVILATTETALLETNQVVPHLLS
jgi:hypothetical protein